MKKKYTNPMMQVVRIHAAGQVLAGSGPVQSVNSTEGFHMDNDGLEEGDVLR